VTSVDCRQALSPDDIAAIHVGMNDYAVLVFRDQRLSDEGQLRFTLQFGTLEETRGGTPGPIHFRTEREVCKLGPSIKDFSNIDAFALRTAHRPERDSRYQAGPACGRRPDHRAQTGA